MDKEDIYTSTGVKFWRHPMQMISFLQGTGKTVISTHISPEGSCNLKCSYCSVSKRNTHERLSISTIENYIETLIDRGLKAVIITGGGEPLLYPQWNELMISLCLYFGKIRFGLITNGTLMSGKDLTLFDWIRISINEEAIGKIYMNGTRIDKDCDIGLSMIFSGRNRELTPSILSQIADRVKAKYIRIIPNCLPEDLDKAHDDIDSWIEKEIKEDDRIFHQRKNHKKPPLKYCPQSYFRPYLSEVGGGTVYPCDSLVLNNGIAYFDDKYKICKAEDIDKFLDGKITPTFIPRKDCNGCVFYDNVMMLNAWTTGYHCFHENTEPIKHEEFV